MESTLIFLFTLFLLSNAQFLPTWGTGLGTGMGTGVSTGMSSGVSTGVSTTTNQMHLPTYGHLPHGHWGGFRDAAGTEYIPYHSMKSDGVLPIPMVRARMPNKMGLQDYTVINMNGGDAEDAIEHFLYKQAVGDMKRPVMGIISIIPGPMAMGGGGTKPGLSYQDQLVDDMMTCVGMDSVDPYKGLPGESRIIFNKPIPYYLQNMHKVKS